MFSYTPGMSTIHSVRHVLYTAIVELLGAVRVLRVPTAAVAEAAFADDDIVEMNMKPSIVTTSDSGMHSSYGYTR
jgi:hypothetical protein